MAKAISTQPIPPFPPDIDRVAFGHWLSGFVDGEGCFFISVPKCSKTGKWRPRVQFIITLRADDFPVVARIRSFLQCGRAYVTHKRSVRNPNSVAVYYAAATADLVGRIIPHFEAHPLQSKKQRDFLVFKAALQLVSQVGKRDRRGTRVGTPGQPWKWMPEDVAAFTDLVQKMRDGRRYVDPVVTQPPSF